MDQSAKVNLKGRGPLKLSPNYTEKDWKAAFNGREKWDTAIAIVEDRMRGRWLDAIDKLLEVPHAGFAIVALDCIVIEALWGFMHGKAVPTGKEKQVYQDILSDPRFKMTAELIESFRDQVRNGIMHDAETRYRWRVEKTAPRDVVAQKNDNGDYVLNRTKFHGALTAVFRDWIAKLRDGDAALLGKMRERMDGIVAKHGGKGLRAPELS